MTQKRITDDLQALLGVLPPAIAEAVTRANNSDNLLEIILDLGRVPLALFVNGEVPLSEKDSHPRGDRLRRIAHRRFGRR